MTFLGQEIQNRFLSLPPDEKRDVCLAMVRVAIEVTREMMLTNPECVDEHLRLAAASKLRGMH